MTEPTDTTTKRRAGPGRPIGLRNQPREKAPAPRLGYRLDEFAQACGISRAAVVRAIKAGTIKTTKIGKNRIIPAVEAQRLMTPR